MTKKNTIIIIGNFAGFILIFLLVIKIGFKFPPDIVHARSLKEIRQIKILGTDSIIELNTEEIEYWKKLEFKKANDEYPGETPDFWAELLGDKASYSAIYNHSDPIVFFQFLPDVKYGFFNSPPPGGWTQPLYYTDVNDTILKLIKYND